MKMRSRLLILKLAASRALPSDCVNIRRSVIPPVKTTMKFPGKRKSKHYFPVNARDPLLQQFQPENETSAALGRRY